MQIYLQFSEREESSTQFKDTNKRAKNQEKSLQKFGIFENSSYLRNVKC
jgi:hypothetical protein